MKLKIEAGGNVTAVYSDRLRSLDLGPMEVTRASNVEFDSASQQWEARTPGGELLASGPERDKVIREEVRIIESRL
jgi:hypothetical protein